MLNLTNQNQPNERAIYLKDLHQWVPVSKTDYDKYYRDIENDGGTEIEAQLIGPYDTDAHYFLGMSKER